MRRTRPSTVVRAGCVCRYLRGDVLGGLYPDGGVPLPGGQDRHLVQELVDAGHQVGAVLGLVRYVMEHLHKRSCFKVKVPRFELALKAAKGSHFKIKVPP